MDVCTPQQGLSLPAEPSIAEGPGNSLSVSAPQFIPSAGLPIAMPPSTPPLSTPGQIPVVQTPSGVPAGGYCYMQTKHGPMLQAVNVPAAGVPSPALLPATLQGIAAPGTYHPLSAAGQALQSTQMPAYAPKRHRTLIADFLEGPARCTGSKRLPSISSSAKEHGCKATFSCNVKAHDDGHTKLLSMGQVAADVLHPFRFGKLIVGVDQYEGTSTTQLSSQSLLNQSGPVTSSVSSFSHTGMQATQLTQDRGLDPHIGVTMQGGVEVSGVKLAYARTFQRAVMVDSNELWRLSKAASTLSELSSGGWTSLQPEAQSAAADAELLAALSDSFLELS
ncbi:hypothetical protein WJX74_005102 [Apatococcus lobatus]|uniref:Uncharacterized protein n=1 Tax=Apatococcus lobatus TaxID=904363 RepID=A0AAW1QD43_9CHLO